MADLQSTTSYSDIARGALPHYGLHEGDLLPIQQLVNASFRVDHAGEQWYLRVYHPDRRGQQEVLAELLWLETLATKGHPVPRPQRTTTGQLVWTTTVNHSTKVHLVSVTNWLPGTILPNEARTPYHYGRVGRLLAELHNVAISWQSPVGFGRPTWDAAGIYHRMLVRDHSEHGDNSASWKQLPAGLRRDLWHACDALQQAEVLLGRESTRYGLLHGDPSFGNLLFHHDQPYLIDFDDCGYGHYVFDLAVVLAGMWDKPDSASNRAILLSAYQDVRPLTTEELTTLPLLMVARAASLIFWAVDHSPVHPWIEGQWQRLRAYLASTN